MRIINSIPSKLSFDFSSVHKAFLSSTSNAQIEWAAYAGIKAKYPNWQMYDAKRNDVLGWGINNPAPYIEITVQEWNANSGIHRHFDNNFDGDPNRSFMNLKKVIPSKRNYKPGKLLFI